MSRQFKLNKKYIFVHIPRTGGTSLQKFWAEVFPPKQVYFYYDGGYYSAADAISLVLKRPFLEVVKRKLTSFNTGKFLYRMYRKISPSQNLYKDIKEPWIFLQGHDISNYILKRYPEAILMTVIRDPLQRAISQYFYIKNQRGSNSKIAEQIFNINTATTLESYLLDNKNRNLQTNFLKERGFSFNDFKVVGVTDALDDFCRYFDPDKSIKLHKINAASRPNLYLSKKIIREFKRLNTEDYLLYRKAYLRSEST